MAPTDYTRSYDFASYQNANPTRPLPGVRVNIELDTIAARTAEINAFIAGFTRTDGELANQSVGLDQLDDSIALGFNPPVAWTADTAYTTNSTVFHENVFYRANVAHTSGSTFDASKWNEMVDFGPAIDDAIDTAISEHVGVDIQAYLGVGTSGYALVATGVGDPQWVGYLQAGTGAVTRTWQEKARDEVPSTDFGVGLSGSTDYTTQLQAWLDYCTANGKCARLKGFPRHSGLSITGTGAKVALVGDPGLSGLIYTGTTGDDLTLNATSAGFNNLHIENIYFDSVSTKTAGVTLRQTGTNGINSQSVLRSLFFSTKTFSSIKLTSASNLLVDDVTIYRIGADGIGLDLSGSSASGTVNGINVSNFTILDGISGTNTTGIKIGDYVYDFQGHLIKVQGGAAPGINYGVWISTTSTDVTVTNDIKFTQSYVDATSKNALRIDGGTEVAWSGGDLKNVQNGFDGVLIAGGVIVTLDQVIITGNQRRGVNVTGGSGVAIRNCVVANNGWEGGLSGVYDGIAIAAGVCDFQITNNTFKNAATGSSISPLNAHRSHIRVALGASDRYVITGNDASATCSSQGVVDQGTGLDKTVALNAGTSSPNGHDFGTKPLYLLGTSSGAASVLARPIAGTPTIYFPDTSGTIITNVTAPLALDADHGTGSITGLAGGVLAGAGPAFTRTPTLGASGTLGSIAFGNATSGLVTLQPVTGALGTVTLSLPAATDTLVGKATTDTLTNKSIDAGQLTGTIVAARMPALTGDITTSAGAVATTLATVNSNVGTFGSATQSVQFTVNAKGLITAAANVTVTPAVGSITGFGTGVATALALNVGSAGAPVTFNGAGGTPSSMTATNLSGTAASLTAGNVTTNANLTGPITSVGNATSIASQTGTGTKFVVDTGPTVSSLTVTTAFTATGLVANASLANMADTTIKGRAVGAGSGVPTDLTAAQAAAIIGSVGGALKSKIITITRDLTVASGNVAYTGVGFTPSSLKAVGSVGGSNNQYVVFYAAADSSRTAMCSYLGGTFWDAFGAAFLFFQNSAGTGNQAATVASYDADGFTLAWTKTGSPTGTATIQVLCER